jgi:hypothetical protein
VKKTKQNIFIARQVRVRAAQFTGTFASAEELSELFGPEVIHGVEWGMKRTISGPERVLILKVVGIEKPANEGDWIIRDGCWTFGVAVMTDRQFRTRFQEDFPIEASGPGDD